MTEVEKVRGARLWLRVFAPFALGYFISYLYRVVNAVIAPDLISDLSLDAAQLGQLTSVYFFTFAAFQLPLGLLLDRYGPRRTEAVLLLFAASGALVFASAESVAGLTIGRGLIGFGVSACLMAAFKAFTQWFPVGRLPLINGLQMAAGGLGALAATTPVQAALSITDWRGVFVVLAIATLAVACAVFWIVPERPPTGGTEGFRSQLRGLKSILASPVFWRIAPWCVTTQAAQLSILSLWSGPWLRDVAGLAGADVAADLAWIAAAMVAGFISMGSIAERLGRWGITPVQVASVAMAIFIVLQAVLLTEPVHLALPVWMAFAFFGTSGIVPYAGLSQRFPAALAGRVNTSLNVLSFSMTFIWQWGIGIIINQWPMLGDGFDPAGYRAAFAVMIVIQLAAAAWYFLMPVWQSKLRNNV